MATNRQVTGPAAAGVELTVRGLRVTYGSSSAVDHIDLDVAPGTTLALLGPSGCGKSTLLRAIAGLEPVAAGQVLIDGREVTRVAPERRHVGLMFQDHALFPHRTVAGNVAFGLRVAGASRAEQASRVGEVLGLVGLAGYGDRTIDTLSGGEAQRVALARALAPNPPLLLLDEPFGSLDRTLRDRLTDEVRDLLAGLGITTVHVTHDQDEACAVADDLAVMRAGRILRTGPLAEVWADPGSPFVARFLGHPNVLDRDQAALLDLPAGPAGAVVPEGAVAFDPAITAGPDGSSWAATVTEVRFRGGQSLATVLLAGDGGVVLSRHVTDPIHPGDPVTVTIDRARVGPLVDDEEAGAGPAAASTDPSIDR